MEQKIRIVEFANTDGSVQLMLEIHKTGDIYGLRVNLTAVRAILDNYAEIKGLMGAVEAGKQG